MPSPAIEFDQVDKRFPSGQQALQRVSITVEEGGIYGFLGPNGAGKTTAVRIINGVLDATGGVVRVLGRPLQEIGQDIHRLSGVLTETASPYEHLSAMDNLRFFGRLYGMASQDVATRAKELLERLDLWDARDRLVREFSTGMKKRISLARALLHRPRLLFLDEPTSGLDPESSRNVNRFIQQLSRDAGVTIFLCTHQLRYAQEICTRYGFIHKGRLLAQGTMEELLQQQGHQPFLEVRGSGLPATVGAVLVRDDIHRIPLPDPSQTTAILKAILDGGGQVLEVRQGRWDLEDLYFSFAEAARAE